MTPDRIVVTGVAGSGKSTVGAGLAEHLGARFVESDDFHSPAHVAKMASGVPLGDADRWPWLAALRQAMRGEERVVVACSALRRPYRDALRRAGAVRFLHLVADRAEIVRRLEARTDHFMPAGLVESQFEALEPPDADETDVASIPADAEPSSVLAAAEEALVSLRPGTAVAPLLADGGEDRAITLDELEAIVARIAEDEIVASGARRVLLVPPDHTRLHSRAGEIAGILFETLRAAGCEVAVLPATGTHAAMTPADTRSALPRARPVRARPRAQPAGRASSGWARSRPRRSPPSPPDGWTRRSRSRWTNSSSPAGTSSSRSARSSRTRWSGWPTSRRTS